MAETDRPEDALIKALESLTGLIGKRVGDRVLPLRDDLDLEGLEFGPALDDRIPLLHDVVQTPDPILPSPRDIERLVDRYLDLRLRELREQLKREIFIELRKRYPHL